ncbi:cobalamin biosynthesis protein, partial [Mycobacterium palustre]
MVATRRRARIAGVLVGYLADLAVGDPQRGHPVALFGRAASRLERFTYRDSKLAGALHVVLLVGVVAVLGAAATPRGRLRSVVAMAAATWVSLGGTSLARTGLEMCRLLERGDVAAARGLL